MNWKKIREWKIFKWRPRKIKIRVLRLRDKILLYMTTILFAALAILNAIEGGLSSYIGITLYVLAAYSLSISCCYAVMDIRYGIREKIKPGIEANPFANRVNSDYRYKTVVFAVPGLVINVIFAVFNGIIGIVSLSPWFGTLAAYYILLSVMRFSAVQYDRSVAKQERTKEIALNEIYIYRMCGLLLIIMTMALGGTVLLMVNFKGGKSYPGFTIYAVAAYTFYKTGTAIRNVLKARKLKSPLLMAIRDIGYIDACVSILSLQTAMFSSFGQNQEELAGLMNGITGTVVCLMVLATGICMIWSAGNMKREVSEQMGGSGND